MKSYAKLNILKIDSWNGIAESQEKGGLVRQPLQTFAARLDPDKAGMQSPAVALLSVDGQTFFSGKKTPNWPPKQAAPKSGPRSQWPHSEWKITGLI